MPNFTCQRKNLSAILLELQVQQPWLLLLTYGGNHAIRGISGCHKAQRHCNQGRKGDIFHSSSVSPLLFPCHDLQLVVIFLRACLLRCILVSFLDAATRPPRRPWPHAVTRRSLSICSSGCSWRRPDDAVEEEGLPELEGATWRRRFGAFLRV